MRPIAARAALLAFLGLSGGCGHAPPRAPAPEIAPVVWPEPPAAPHARLAFVAARLPPPPARPWWRVAIDWLAGVDGGAEGAALQRPFDVALLADGGWVVADPDLPAVVRYSASGEPTASLACEGQPWGSPMSVAEAADGAIWVADASSPAVVRWTSQGCRVSRPEGLQRPTGIALAGDRVLVADPPAHRVLVLAQDGRQIATWGERGDGPGQFNFPTDLAVAPDGTVLVVDALHFRVARLGPDGAWLGAFGAPGDEGAGFSRPKGIATRGDRVYVTDAQRDLLLVFRADGTLACTLGGPGAGPGQLTHPAGLSATASRLAVADSLNRRIQVHEILGECP